MVASGHCLSFLVSYHILFKRVAGLLEQMLENGTAFCMDNAALGLSSQYPFIIAALRRNPTCFVRQSTHAYRVRSNVEGIVFDPVSTLHDIIGIFAKVTCQKFYLVCYLVPFPKVPFLTQ